MTATLLFATHKIDSEVQINFQDPLVHVTPLSERPFELRYHVVGKEEYGRLLQGEKISNLNRYRAYRRVREAEESKCPFGF